MAATTHQQIDPADLDQFLRRYYEDDLADLAVHYPREQSHLEISWRDLFRYSELPDITQDLREHPRQVVQQLTHAVENYDLPTGTTLEGVEVRISDLPESEVRAVNKVWEFDVGQYGGVSGQVSKVSDVSKEPVELAFECQRCGNVTRYPQAGNEIQEPHECGSCERQGPFQVDYEQSEFRPHQLVRVQQPPEETKGGSGAHIDAHLRETMVNTVEPGDRASINGVYALAEPEGSSRDFEEYVDAKGVDFAESDYEDIDVEKYEDEIIQLANGEQGDIFELLKDSIAPKIHGYDTIKEAVALQMFGGVRSEYPDGTIDRGDSHVLLLGDPGTAKSSILRAVETLAPRSVYVSGKGASSAGLTAAATKDDFGDAEWSLEAGALVLANKGIACVDEIDKVDDSAVSSMHDALEAQRVTVNKAGINATLPAQTSMLAAGNPKYGRFDPMESIADQIELGPTMLSRFDLMFMVDDEPDEEKDREIAERIVESRQLANEYTRSGADPSDERFDSIKPAIPADTFRAYVAYAKEHVTPRIRDTEVAEDLVDSFVNFRNMHSDADGPIPVTFRKLEGIQRWAEASARVRLSETVEKQDVDRARELVGRSMRQVGMDPDTGKMDVDIIESGTSTSQRQRKKALRQIIQENQGDTGGAPKDTILEEAEERGISRDRAEHDLEVFKAEGEAYEPQTGEYRLT